MNGQKHNILSINVMLGFSILTFPACSGLFDDIYDEYKLQSTEGKDNVLHVDATDYETWTYIELHGVFDGSGVIEQTVLPIPLTLTGEWDGQTCYTHQEIKHGTTTELSSIHTDSQPEPEHWDIAIHHFDFRTNGGQSFETGYTSLEQVPDKLCDIPNVEWENDRLTTDRVWVDLSNSLAFDIGCQTIAINLPLSHMVWMDVSNPPPIYNVTGNVCLLRLNDGNILALSLDSYINDRGQKGHLCISFKTIEN